LYIIGFLIWVMGPFSLALTTNIYLSKWVLSEKPRFVQNQIHDLKINNSAFSPPTSCPIHVGRDGISFSNYSPLAELTLLILWSNLRT
jgi:hypothetical protein